MSSASSSSSSTRTSEWMAANLPFGDIAIPRFMDDPNEDVIFTPEQKIAVQERLREICEEQQGVWAGTKKEVDQEVMDQMVHMELMLREERLKASTEKLQKACAKKDPMPLWMRVQKDRLKLCRDVLATKSVIPGTRGKSIGEKGKTSTYVDIDRFCYGEGQRINAAFSEQHTYYHNGRPLQAIYITYEDAPLIERECYLASILSPMRVLCFYLRSKEQDPVQEQQIVLKDGMKDVILPYMCLPSHQPDTLFLVHEADFRLTPQSCKVSCFDEAPDFCALTESELATLQSTTATTYKKKKKFSRQRKCHKRASIILMLA